MSNSLSINIFTRIDHLRSTWHYMVEFQGRFIGRGEGWAERATPLRLHLLACIRALDSIDHRRPVTIYTSEVEIANFLPANFSWDEQPSHCDLWYALSHQMLDKDVTIIRTGG